MPVAGMMSVPSADAFCGNGIVEGDEQCERGSSLPTCLQFFGLGAVGLLTCKLDCFFDLSLCSFSPEEDAGSPDCEPGNACIDGDGSYGVCGSPHHGCEHCLSDAQCSNIYGPRDGLCIGGRCRQCDDARPCEFGAEFCMSNSCYVPL